VNGDSRHLPYAAPIEAYGKGGFRIAGVSHRGSLLCLPDGVWASPITKASEIDAVALSPVFERQELIGHFLVGTGPDLVPLPAPLRAQFREHNIVVEVMSTGAAIRTYNILLEERRPVGALLIGVD
jgi:uncharacterized protein